MSLSDLKTLIKKTLVSFVFVYELLVSFGSSIKQMWMLFKPISEWPTNLLFLTN